MSELKSRIIDFIIHKHRITVNITQALKNLIKLEDIAFLLNDAKSCPISQSIMGYLHHHGFLVEKSNDKAMEYYKKSIDQGCSVSLIDLGYIFEKYKFYDKALECYQKSADQGNLFALIELGDLHFYGYGTEQNYYKTFELYKKSADLGCAKGLNDLGFMYGQGLGTVRDYNKAIECYKKAGEQGYVLALYNLAILYFYGRGIAINLDKAFELFKICAEQGFHDGMCELTQMYLSGIGIKQDYDITFELYMKNADHSNGKKLNDLGMIYYRYDRYAHKDIVITSNYDKAFELIKMSAERGFPESYRNLARIYYYGHGTELNYNKALCLYEKYEEIEKSAEVEYILAGMYEKAIGVERNIVMAMKYYLLCKKNGYLYGAEALTSFLNLNAFEIFSIMIESAATIKDMKHKINELETEVEELQISAPIEGGPLYKQALDRFNSCRKRSLLHTINE